MRVVVLFILAIPVSIALQCINSATENGADVTGLGEQQKSCADLTKFCFTDVGTFDKPDLNGSVTCCTGDFCNPAASASMMISPC